MSEEVTQGSGSDILSGNAESTSAPAQTQGTPTSEPNNQSTTTNFEELPKWTAALTPDTRTKHFEDLKAINGPEDITRMAFELREKLDGAIFKPGENASEEDVAAYAKAMGVPLDKSDYKFDVPEDSGMASMVDGLRDLAFNKQFSSEQAEAVSEFLVASEKQAMEKLNTEMEKLKEDSERTLRTEYGDKYDAKINRANNLIRNYAPEGFQGFLDETRLGNNAEFIQFAVKMSELISDDKLNEGTKSGSRTADDYYSFPNTEGMQ